MALAEWGRWDDEVDPVTLVELQVAYIRRQRWLAQLQAAEIVRALAGGTSDSGPGGYRYGVSASGRRYREVSVEGMMAEMGAT